MIGYIEELISGFGYR